MRNNDGSINYLLGDHLGSVSTVVDASGLIVSQSRYLPFGELLWENGTSPTDYSYTGQRSLSDIGLMDYNARFYDPMLGRFTSPDSIVPDPDSVIGYNRYAYVNNNPMIYTDPSGHCYTSSGVWIPGGGDGNCSFRTSTEEITNNIGIGSNPDVAGNSDDSKKQRESSSSKNDDEDPFHLVIPELSDEVYDALFNQWFMYSYVTIDVIYIGGGIILVGGIALAVGAFTGSVPVAAATGIAGSVVGVIAGVVSSKVEEKELERVEEQFKIAEDLNHSIEIWQDGDRLYINGGGETDAYVDSPMATGLTKFMGNYLYWNSFISHWSEFCIKNGCE